MAGRKFDFVYRFHDIDDLIPSADDQLLVNSGAILHIDIDPRKYGTSDPFSVTWVDIAAGRYDDSLRAQARGIAALREPVFITFGHEPDQDRKSQLGSSADFVEAWRHVRKIYSEEGAENTVWVWVVMALPATFRTALEMWPGNEYVDWISWDAYDEAGCRSGVTDPSKSRSFADVASPFYDYLITNGADAGIDVRKPMMISETATAVGGSDWYERIPDYLRENPQIKAVGLWDHSSSSPSCKFSFSDSGIRSAGVRRAGEDEWLNPLKER